MDRTVAAERIWFQERPSFFDGIFWLGDRKGPQVQIHLPRYAWMDFHSDWAVMKTRSHWTVAGTAYMPDTLLGLASSDILAGAPDASFAADRDSVLRSIRMKCADQILDFTGRCRDDIPLKIRD